MHAPLSLLAAALLAAPGIVAAQQTRCGLLAGGIVDADGTPVADAVVRATRGARTVLAQTGSNGVFRVAGLSAGGWTVSVRRLGFTPTVTELEIPAERLYHDISLQVAPRMLDPMLVEARWTGVRGVVEDARRILPLAGALVHLLGTDARVSSDSSGGFALAVPAARAVVLRVERTGFEPRLLSVTIPTEGYLELDLPLDTTPQPSVHYGVWRDLDQRLKYATPRAVQVIREELEATEATSLGVALATSRPVMLKGVLITRRSCVYVNGIARPGLPVAALGTDDVEFVEAYPPGSDLTRTLAMRWPPGGICGAADAATGTAHASDRQVAQFVSVWLRAP